MPLPDMSIVEGPSVATYGGSPANTPAFGIAGGGAPVAGGVPGGLGAPPGSLPAPIGGLVGAPGSATSVEPGVPPPEGPTWKAFPDRFADAYREERRAGTRVANGEEESACTARDGLEAVRVAVAATRSMREHRPVKVAEVD